MDPEATMRASESLCQKVIQEHLAPKLVVHVDDGSRSAQHDFEIRGTSDGLAEGAIEATQDISTASGQWSHLAGTVFTVRGCALGWAVNLTRPPLKPRKFVKISVTPFLQSLEEAGSRDASVYPDSDYRGNIPAALTDSGFTNASAQDHIPSGHVHLTISGWHDAYSTETRNRLSDWVTEFANSERCIGERAKLAESGLSERHLAVVVGFATPPFFHLQMAHEFGLPLSDPELPSEVTHVWLVSDYPGLPSAVYDAATKWTELPIQRPNRRGPESASGPRRLFIRPLWTPLLTASTSRMSHRTVVALPLVASVSRAVSPVGRAPGLRDPRRQVPLGGELGRAE